MMPTEPAAGMPQAVQDMESSRDVEAFRSRYKISKREMKAMLLIVFGDGHDSNKHIGKLMGVSEGTAKCLVANAIAKLKVSSRTQAALTVQRALQTSSNGVAPKR